MGRGLVKTYHINERKCKRSENTTTSLFTMRVFTSKAIATDDRIVRGVTERIFRGEWSFGRK